MGHRRLVILISFAVGLLVTGAMLGVAEAAVTGTSGNSSSYLASILPGQRLAGPPPMALGIYQEPAPTPTATPPQGPTPTATPVDPAPQPNTSHLPGILNNAGSGW